MAHLAPRKRCDERGLARVQHAVSRTGQGRRREREGRLGRDRETHVPQCERDGTPCHHRTRAEAVDERARDGRCHDGETGDRSDDETSDGDRKAALIAQVDQLEREYGAIAEGVDEDGGLDQPESLVHGLTIKSPLTGGSSWLSCRGRLYT